MCGTLTKAWHTSLQNCVGLLRARPASVAGPSTEPQPGPEAGAERATATEPGPEAGVEHSSEQLPRPDLDTGALNVAAGTPGAQLEQLADGLALAADFGGQLA